jgi:hypothetical protein
MERDGWSTNKKRKERRREEAKMANQRNKEAKTEGEKNDDDITKIYYKLTGKHST